MSFCPSVRMNAEISETIQATILGLGMQIPEISAQCKFVSAECHAHSNANKLDARIEILTEMCWSCQYLSIDAKKKFATPTLTPKNRRNL